MQLLWEDAVSATHTISLLAHCPFLTQQHVPHIWSLSSVPTLYSAGSLEASASFSPLPFVLRALILLFPRFAEVWGCDKKLPFSLLFRGEAEGGNDKFTSRPSKHLPFLFSLSRQCTQSEGWKKSLLPPLEARKMMP